MKEFKIKSSTPKLDLSVLLISPKKPKAVIQLSHGMIEYKEKYIPFMEFLKENGYASIIHDIRGHGKSIKEKDKWGNFYDNTGTSPIIDLYLVTKHIKTIYKDLPIHMYSHSLGTLIARNYLKEHDNELQSLILSGAPYYNKEANFGILYSKIKQLINGPDYYDYFVDKTNYKTLQKGYNNAPNEWLYTNYEEHKHFPKEARFKMKINGYLNIFLLMKNAFKTNYQVKNKSLQILFLSGEKDNTIGNTKQYEHTKEFIRKQGYKNISELILKGLRHETLFDYNKEDTYQQILEFLNKNTKK